MKKKILVTGGNGRFAKILKEKNNKLNLIFVSKKECNILDIKSIQKIFKKIKPNIIFHCAGLSRPMSLHERQVVKSINLNISGTANITMACAKFNVKLIYFSTLYVYPCKKGNYTEKDALLPFNNYGWSKLGGETSVHMYKNSLILRICMTEKPFVHKKAFADVKTNFIFHDELVPIFKKLLNKKGVINLGGPVKTIFNFAKKNKKDVKKIFAKKTFKGKFPLNPSMSLKKMNKLLK